MEDMFGHENLALSSELRETGEGGLPMTESRSFSHIHGFIVNSSTIMLFPEREAVKTFCLSQTCPVV